MQSAGDQVPHLALDTVVALDWKSGEAQGPAEAAAMLRKLSRKEPSGYAGLALFYREKVLTHVETHPGAVSLLEEDIRRILRLPASLWIKPLWHRGEPLFSSR